MDSIPRRSIEELCSRYEMEPELKDYYVEGVFDREVFTQVQGGNSDGVVIYEIDTVDVSAEILRKFGLTNGNKQRVVALAKELAAQLNGDFQYKCFVDRDMDHWFGDLCNVPRLKWSDYSSIELYFFSRDIIIQILVVLARAKLDDAEIYLSSVTSTLTEIYSLRLASCSMGLALKALDLDKQLTVKEGRISFDSAEYSKRWLAKSNQLGVLQEFNASATAWRGRFNVDPRICIRGHDFVDLLAWSIKKFRGLDELASPVAVERLFLAMTDRAPELMNYMKG